MSWVLGAVLDGERAKNGASLCEQMAQPKLSDHLILIILFTSEIGRQRVGSSVRLLKSTWSQGTLL